jgi:hypothetical protein
MYVTTPDLDVLRQGDVLDNIYFPKYNFSELVLGHRIDKSTGAAEFSGLVTLKCEQRKVVVVSQCCEFNPGKRRAFSLAAFFGFSEYRQAVSPSRRFNIASLSPFSKTSQRRNAVDEIRTANRVVPGEPNASWNTFLYDQFEDLLPEPHVVEFTHVISVSMNDVDFIRSHKVLELDNTARRLLQVKLGFFYARSAED